MPEDASQGSQSPPPGWYSDPEQPTQQRYWDGGRWTDDRRSAESPEQPPPPQTQQAVYVERATNGFAVVALVCGIVGVVVGLIPILFFLAWALGLVALVFGILGWRRVRRDPTVGRKGMSIAGTMLGVLALIVGGVGYAIVEDAFEDVDEALEELEGDGSAGESESGTEARPAVGQESPAFVRTSLDSESGATAVLPQGRRTLESFGPSRQRTRVDTRSGAVIIDYTPQDAPNPGPGYSTTGGSVSNANLGATAAEYATGDCQEGSFCINYPIDLGGYGFGVLTAADSRAEARAIGRRAARTLDAPPATLQPPDVVEDCVSEFEPNVSDMTVRNMSCPEADDFIIAAIQNLRPGTFESAGFSCQILGRYGPPDGPVLGAENVRCAQGDRAFRFSWGD